MMDQEFKKVLKAMGEDTDHPHEDVLGMLIELFGAAGGDRREKSQERKEQPPETIRPHRWCYCGAPCRPKVVRCPWCGGYFDVPVAQVSEEIPKMSVAQVLEEAPEIPLEAYMGLIYEQVEASKQELNDRLVRAEIDVAAREKTHDSFRRLFMGIG